MPMDPNEDVTGRNHGGPGDDRYDHDGFMAQNDRGDTRFQHRLDDASEDDHFPNP